ncbi:hypothetical protein [Lysinibacillus xylanilyticus]
MSPDSLNFFQLSVLCNLSETAVTDVLVAKAKRQLQVFYVT